MHLTLAPGVLDEVVAHARSGLPEESCGLVVGRNGIGERFIPMKNALSSTTAYEMDPGQLASTFRALRSTGEEVIAIYHSHPKGPAEPSQRDIERAYYPEAVHLIVGFQNADKPSSRAFRIPVGEVGEVLEVEVHAIV